MGRRLSGALPVKRVHAKTGHAFVWINKRQHWLGRNGTPEAQLRYEELIAAYLASGKKSVEAVAPTPAPKQAPAPPPPPASLTIGELCERWLHHIKAGRTDWKESSLWQGALAATRALRRVATFPARDFGPRQLLEVRDALAASQIVRVSSKGTASEPRPRSRRYVNDTCQRIIQGMKWAAVRELIPGDKLAALEAVPKLRPGESSAVVETPARQPVPDDRIEAVLIHLRPPLAALVKFVRLTGCRPGEAAQLRLIDIQDREKDVWRYCPRKHKNAWRGQVRHIAIGAKTQRVILDALGDRGEDAYVFDPRLAVPDRQRRTDGTISMEPRKPSERVGDRYTTDAIRVGILRACEKAKCPGWHTYLLRYSRAAEARREHGSEAGLAILGDRSPAMLNHYAPSNWEAAAAAARATG